MRHLFLLTLCLATAAEPDSSTVDLEARQLVQEMLTQVPTEAVAASGQLVIRDSNGRRRKIPFSQTITIEPTGWKSLYETHPTAASGGSPERLEVMHRLGAKNEYWHSKNFKDLAAIHPPASLTGDAATQAFAGSDFWLSDLGLEFLTWPEQRLIRGNKVTMQNSRPFKTLESVNPHPDGSNYARVVSRIDSEYKAVIRAEAYDSDGALLKVFALKSVNKQGQVRRMEIRNEKEDTRTTIEFSYEANGDEE